MSTSDVDNARFSTIESHSHVRTIYLTWKTPSYSTRYPQLRSGSQVVHAVRFLIDGFMTYPHIHTPLLRLFLFIMIELIRLPHEKHHREQTYRRLTPA